eukprot:7847604-Lingulodinium_polyedra.AAC.1
MAPTVWGPDHWRDAVAVFPRAGALPAMIALATEACPRLGVQVGVRAGAMLLRNLMPDHVDAVLAI